MMTSEFHPLLVDFAVGLTLVGWVAVIVACFLWDRDAPAGPDAAPDSLELDHPPAIVPGPLGDPDLDAPSASADALEEVARLEALWALPPREADTHRD
jgi:hypothetical protein